MPRKFIHLGLCGIFLAASAGGRANAAVLLALGDASQLSEVQLAKVVADDSSLWLSVRLRGHTRLALVTERASVESAPAADSWLRALDFATRVRVAAPPGAAAGCAASTHLELADSGLPESLPVAALQVSSASTELELRRLLADAELPVDVSRIAQFTTDAEPPFQIAIYDVPALGGTSEALRLIDHGHPAELPRITLSGAQSVPVSLIALAKDGLLPLAADSADASEFPVTYRAIDASCDYRSARSGWLAQNPMRWLNEVQASAALFAETSLGGEAIPPVVSRYFGAVPSARCAAQVQAARARASLNVADFACGGADDLARTLSEVDFADLRVSRFIGLAGDEGMKFRVAASVPRSPLLLATDLDFSGCGSEVSQPANASGNPVDFTPPTTTSAPGLGVPEDPYYYPAAPSSEGSATVTVVHIDSSDSCTGDSSSDDSSGDSCSGDSSSSDSNDDSCSGDSGSSDSNGDSCTGDSSSDDSGTDSCSGDSSDSKSDGCSGDSDSSGRGKSDDEGDACSGNSASGNSAKRSAGLRAGSAAHRRPRQVRLSLLTLLAAALALPLRRLRAWR